MKDPATPSLTLSSEGEIVITISRTQALVNEQGYTYNQVGFTYNQAGVSYGGVYNSNQDSVPMSLSFEDIYTKFVPPVIGKNIPLGPGFFLFIPQ